jgi:hypothetical protein
MEQSFSSVIVRSNVVQALIELGSINEAARLLDAASQGKGSDANRFDCAAHATVGLLRGNQSDAQSLWTDYYGLPTQHLSHQMETARWELEFHFWCNAFEQAFDESHSLLERAAAAHNDRLSGYMLAFTGPLLVLAMRACADLAEHARVNSHSRDMPIIQRRADQLSELRRRVALDPFTPGPLRPNAPADRAQWRAEWSRLRGESDPRLWEHAAKRGMR